MKVGYFVETPVEHNLTGGVRSFLNLIEQLIPMGIEPYVVVSEEWALTEKLEQMGVPVLTAKMFRPFVGVVDHVRFEREKYWIKTLINNRAKRKAISWFRKNGVQLVHINSQFAGVVGAQVAKALKIPYIYHMREYLDKDFGVTFYSDKLVQKHIIPADRIIGISKSIQQHYENKLGRDVELVYNGIPAREDNCFACDGRLTGGVTQLAIVGRVNPAKGQLEAVKAVRLLKEQYGHSDFCLNIIGYLGTDTYELELKKYVEEHGLSDYVIFHRFTNQPAQILKNCDVGLTCSVKEAFGRVTVEYMLAGLFTIGANTGGTPEIILDGETGLLYEQGSEADLAEKIHWVLQNKVAAKEMLQKGHQRGTDVFSIHATAEKVLAVYKELIR